MLVLQRQVGTSLQIGEDITIHVLSIKGQYVRLGIDAPRDMTIYRTETLTPDSQEGTPCPTDAENP